MSPSRCRSSVESADMVGVVSPNRIKANPTITTTSPENRTPRTKPRINFFIRPQYRTTVERVAPVNVLVDFLTRGWGRRPCFRTDSGLSRVIGNRHGDLSDVVLVIAFGQSMTDASV